MGSVYTSKNDGPSLPELIRDPSLAKDLEPEAVPALLSDIEGIRARLWRRLHEPSEPDPPPSPASDATEQSENDDEPFWREKLWTCPAETRLWREDLEEALGVKKEWIHRRTQSKADDPIPHRPLGRRLLFLAGEVRHWVRQQEDIAVAGPSAPSPDEKRRLEVVEESDES